MAKFGSGKFIPGSGNCRGDTSTVLWRRKTLWRWSKKSSLAPARFTFSSRLGWWSSTHTLLVGGEDYFGRRRETLGGGERWKMEGKKQRGLRGWDRSWPQPTSPLEHLHPGHFSKQRFGSWFFLPGQPWDLSRLGKCWECAFLWLWTRWASRQQLGQAPWIHPVVSSHSQLGFPNMGVFLGIPTKCFPKGKKEDTPAAGCPKSMWGNDGEENPAREGGEGIRTLFLYNIEKIQIFIVIFFWLPFFCLFACFVFFCCCFFVFCFFWSF